MSKFKSQTPMNEPWVFSSQNIIKMNATYSCHKYWRDVRLSQWLLSLTFHNLRITKVIGSLHGPLNHQINPKQMSFVLYNLTFMTTMDPHIRAYGFEPSNYEMMHGAINYRGVVELHPAVGFGHDERVLAAGGVDVADGDEGVVLVTCLPRQTHFGIGGPRHSVNDFLLQ